MMTKLFPLILVIFFCNQTVFAEEQKSVFLGHLLTPTTYTPKKNTVTAGSHIVGYSLNDNLLVGTSSFLTIFYNSPNLFFKYSKLYNEKSRWAFQFDYLKSSNKPLIKGNTFYEMEALMLWGLWSKDINSFYTIHYSLNYMYFINEGKPHSLRREPFNDQPFQFSLTSLHEVKVSDRYGIAAEVGILGLNYTAPNLHLGVTFRYTSTNFLIQVGMSLDYQLWGSEKAAEYANSNDILEFSHRVNLLTHPEIGFQYFF